MLSIVVPALNGAHTIGRTLSSILSNDFPKDEYEVIVVDNGSTDNTIEVCRKFPVKIFSCQKKGQGAALNQGIENTAGEIVCITNSDVVVPREWLSEISEFFSKHPSIDGIGGPVLAPANNLNDIQKFTGELFVEDQMFPTEVTRVKYLEVAGSLYSANCAYKKETLIQIGGFDESLLEYMDVDLCWKLVRMGYSLFFIPYIKVIHLGFPWTVRGVLRQQFKWGKGNTICVQNYSDVSAEDKLKTEIFASYQLVRAFLFLFSPNSYGKTKQLLRFIHYFSYYFGRIWGGLFVQKCECTDDTYEHSLRRSIFMR